MLTMGPEEEEEDIQIWIAICGVHMAKFLFLGRNFVSGIYKL